MNLRYAGLALVGILLAALYLLNRKDISADPMLKITLHPITATGSELKGVMELNNPNLLSSTIKNIHEKFYLHGQLLGVLDNELNQGIPGLKTTEFPFSVRIANSDLQQGINNDSGHILDTIIMISGKIEFQNLFHAGKIEIQQQPLLAHE